VELETRAIEMLFSGDNAALEQLGLQWRSCEIENREFTAVGFFTRFDVPQHIPRTSLATFEIGDVDAWISGIQIGLLLFVRGCHLLVRNLHLPGAMATLAGY